MEQLNINHILNREDGAEELKKFWFVMAICVVYCVFRLCLVLSKKVTDIGF